MIKAIGHNDKKHPSGTKLDSPAMILGSLPSRFPSISIPVTAITSAQVLFTCACVFTISHVTGLGSHMLCPPIYFNISD